MTYIRHEKNLTFFYPGPAEGYLVALLCNTLPSYYRIQKYSFLRSAAEPFCCDICIDQRAYKKIPHIPHTMELFT